jgi:ABC-type antimicrobial peptide transport system permease subunit
MGVTALIMILCFFSLMSSMHTNIMEQYKDIGILRSIGMTAFSIGRTYVEEAFVDWAVIVLLF